MTGAKIEVTVKIHERYLLACSAYSGRGNDIHISWYRCSTYDCQHHWNKLRIAQVNNVKETIADDPNFNVYTNGTLVIKKVLPVDDGKMFICIVHEWLLGRNRSATILHIAKGDVYSSVM